jgi:universal stress protein A
MNWQTLLVPHDFSPSADRAMAVASDLARHHNGARIVLLHVTHLPPGLTADAMITDRGSGDLVRVDAFARTESLRELDQRAQTLRSAGIPVELRATLGDVVEQVLRVAEDERADLIVMGTHGRTGLAHFFLGSIAEKVLRQATIPVLTVRVQVDEVRTTAEFVLQDLATD